MALGSFASNTIRIPEADLRAALAQAGLAGG